MGGLPPIFVCITNCEDLRDFCGGTLDEAIYNFSLHRVQKAELY